MLLSVDELNERNVILILIVTFTISGVASYGALGHVPLPLDFQQFHFSSTLE